MSRDQPEDRNELVRVELNTKRKLRLIQAIRNFRSMSQVIDALINESYPNIAHKSFDEIESILGKGNTK